MVYAVDIGSLYSPAQTFPTYGTLVTVIVKNAFVLAAIVSFVLLVFGGFAVIVGAGGGDSKRIDQGKQAITGAVVGLMIVVGSFAIVEILSTLTGVQLLGQ